DVSALAALVCFDEPLPQFDRIRFRHIPVRSELDHRGKFLDQLNRAVGLGQQKAKYQTRRCRCWVGWRADSQALARRLCPFRSAQLGRLGLTENRVANRSVSPGSWTSVWAYRWSRAVNACEGVLVT